jgi:hypothetical protein
MAAGAGWLQEPDGCRNRMAAGTVGAIGRDDRLPGARKREFPAEIRKPAKKLPVALRRAAPS